MVWTFCNSSVHSVCVVYQEQDRLCVNLSTRELTNRQESADLRVYITGDGSDVYEDSFMNIARADGTSFKPTLILVGTRLGIDKVTAAYWEALKSSLKMPQSMGIAGYVFRTSIEIILIQSSVAGLLLLIIL